MYKDLHEKPFDEGTKVKLEIFRDYLKEWLPVFLSTNTIYWNKINIYDFFSGPGQDIVGVKGTPGIIIEELNKFEKLISEKKLNIDLYFNEFDNEKYLQLNRNIQGNVVQSDRVSFETDNLDFKDSFNKKLVHIKNEEAAKLLFLDQNGIKHISDEVFQQIIGIKRTDFLFFISSSTIKRFSEHPNILQHINLSPIEVERTPYHKIHKLVLEYYRGLIPSGKEYYLAGFSLKKGTGIYGLIFGSSHVLGIQKFLKTCWKIDPVRGEANFNIDNEDLPEGQINLFTGEESKPKKLEIFESELQKRIVAKELVTDREIYLFTLLNGFIPSHAKSVLKKLVERSVIEKSNFLIDSQVCKQNHITIKVKVLKNVTI